MGRLAAIVGVVALVIGLGVGYLWWGRAVEQARQSATEARERVETLERESAAARTSTARPDEAASLRARVQALESELEQERQMRHRLETQISQGKK